MATNTGLTILSQFKEITTRICELCESKKRPCSERVAAYTLRAVTLDASSEFEFEKTLTLKQLQNLVEVASERVLDMDNPAIETIKMQAAFDGIGVFVDEQIRKGTLLQEEETNKQIDQIVEFASRLKSDAQVTNLYKLVFDLLVLNSCVDSIDRNVEREVAAALQSAFPKPRIKAFAQMTADQKREQIGGLINIVLGIRLFNRSIGKGGAGLSDTPSELDLAIKDLLRDLQDEITTVTSASERYSEVIRVEFAFPGTVSSSMSRLQDEFRNRQQYFAYLSRIHMDVSEVKGLVDNAISHFSTEMEALRSLVGSRVSLPKGQVFPKFDALGRLWRALDAELERLNGKRTVFQELLKFKQNFQQSLCKEDIDLLADNDLKARIEEKEAEDARIAAAASAAEEKKRTGKSSLHDAVLLRPGDVPNFSELELEFEGYCPWTIVHRDALLLPGDLTLGIVRYRNKYYAVVDEAAANAFMKNPDKYLEVVAEKVKAAPELIHLLHLQDQYPDVESGFSETAKHSIAAYGEPNKTSDASTETPTHFVESNIDRNYLWNEWDYRRQALHMVRLRKAATHSTQTNQSHFRRSAETQVYCITADKDKQEDGDDKTMPGVGTQTGISKETNTVVRRRYLGGLRGHPKSKLSVVNLEL